MYIFASLSIRYISLRNVPSVILEPIDRLMTPMRTPFHASLSPIYAMLSMFLSLYHRTRHSRFELDKYIATCYPSHKSIDAQTSCKSWYIRGTHRKWKGQKTQAHLELPCLQHICCAKPSTSLPVRFNGQVVFLTHLYPVRVLFMKRRKQSGYIMGMEATKAIVQRLCTRRTTCVQLSTLQIF